MQNNTNATLSFILPSSSAQIFTGIVMIIQGVVELPLSYAVIYLILSRHSLRKSVNFIVLNGILTETVTIHQWIILNGYYFFVSQDQNVCFAGALLRNLCTYTAHQNYALLGFNRYFALHHDVRYPDIFTTRNTVVMLATAWLIALGLVTPLFPYLRYDGTHICSLDVSMTASTWTFAYAGIILCLGIVLYASIIVFNRKVEARLTALRKQLANSNFTSATLEQGNFENIRKLLNFHIIAPGFLVLPYHLVKAVVSSLYSFALFSPILPAAEQYFPWLGRIAVTLEYSCYIASLYATLYFLKPFRDELKAMAATSLKSLSFVATRLGKVAPIASDAVDVVSGTAATHQSSAD